MYMYKLTINVRCLSPLLRFAFVEFAVPESVPIALQYNGAMFGERPIK